MSKMIKIPILYINKDTTLQQKIVVSTQYPRIIQTRKKRNRKYEFKSVQSLYVLCEESLIQCLMLVCSSNRKYASIFFLFLFYFYFYSPLSNGFYS